MPDLIPFTFDTHTVRVHLDDTGQPWWEAQDVCPILGIRDVSQAMTRLKLNEKRTSKTRNVLIINESGLYRLIFRSNKPEAQRFQDWIFTEVLPEIRKTGSYGQGQTPAVVNPEHQIMIDMIVRIDQTEQRALQAEKVANQAERKADMALNSQEYYTVAEYIYLNSLQRQLPESGYRAASDHLRHYCLEQRIPFRKQAVGGKRWEEEYAFHIGTYTAALMPWLSRRDAQSNLRVLPPKTEESS